ncbi:U6 snRNA-associated Sm-like protein LSm2, putative [Plasmodium vinckei]|uniref:U6 snRNA-associated Sm-like protein LSm2 n=5 Tax=Plasmodium (Vinckeia) TaxID=418101 RepID=A0A1C6YJ24_PLACE|nr:U6 snRNA-associated Sm-like protein LSm2, putative [Plasmodium chabaudi chabaudi]CAD2099079.1 U6 snRNA-associated Sm-like protein LSm2, putative [Plasmodium vinckei brucechwatti]CAD2110152.1 U6 snRNA-associated Sm-like protein LSm2, putative [Plasmodium vinckei]CAD2110251.1 U6 snRNA-associated Sm-like protein LSm2, putative [Plasmodium vinckei petteri]SCM23298.1 U6 snRNA-associated Sm-like protein LSm2, putative [Plasmodium chabaudi adami]SCN63658.1 U6 snRNA-associated Sm-like protein LSm2,|eukprot:XP_016654331.1 U6 snRNA-associated Sm-like protein LSm2, putative [Plasmodium chabaudi chabaudi]
MLFFTFFQQLAEKNQHITIELKNDLQISGVLHSVDQYLNIKLTNISVNNPEKYPHLLSIKSCFVRGSVVRYVFLPSNEVNIDKLRHMCRQEAKMISDKEKNNSK